MTRPRSSSICRAGKSKPLNATENSCCCGFRRSMAPALRLQTATPRPPPCSCILGMTGQIAPNPAAQPCEKHTHACFLLDDNRELRYTDARRFGRLAYLSAEPLAEELRSFGADPLEISVEEFVKQTRVPPRKDQGAAAGSELFAGCRKYLCGRKSMARENSSGAAWCVAEKGTSRDAAARAARNSGKSNPLARLVDFRFS